MVKFTEGELMWLAAFDMGLIIIGSALVSVNMGFVSGAAVFFLSIGIKS